MCSNKIEANSNGYNTIIPAERQNRIVEYITKVGSGKISELAGLLNVSEATIRRDLTDLDKAGLLERTHGGAVINKGSTSFEFAHSDRLGIELDKKGAIGDAAKCYVRDGDTIFLDSGTTSYQLALNLSAYKNITVITYDLFIANAVTLHPTSSMILTGGIKREGYSVVVGSITENFIRDIRVKTVFLTCDAIDVSWGLSNANFIEAGIKKCLLTAGDRVILLADSTKFGQKTIAKVCDLSSIDILITDNKITSETISALTEKSVEVVIANSNSNIITNNLEE